MQAGWLLWPCDSRRRLDVCLRRGESFVVLSSPGWEAARRPSMSRPLSVLLRSAALVLALIPIRVVAQTENSIYAVDQLSKRLDELRAEVNKIEAQLSELRRAKGIPAPNAVAPPSAGAPSGTAPASQQGTIQSTQPPAQGPTSRQVG